MEQCFTLLNNDSEENREIINNIQGEGHEK